MVQAVTNRNVIGVLLLALAGRAIVQVSLHCYPMLATVVTIRHGQLVQPKLGLAATIWMANNQAHCRLLILEIFERVENQSLSR